MCSFAYLLFTVMDLGAHGHLSCAIQYVKTWYQLLVHEVHDVLREELLVEGGEGQIQRITVFEVKTFLYVLTAEIYHSDMRVKRLQHISVS